MSLFIFIHMIWIFGDSYSTSFNNSSVFNNWGKEYINLKGYVPKTFGDIISDELNVGVNHMAIGGIGNDSIFEMIYENAPLMSKDDIIIIGWSSIVRYRLSGKSNRWITIIPNFETHMDNLINVSESTIEELLINRTSSLFREEFKKRKEFLNWLFKENIIIHWTPFSDQFNVILGYGSINTIESETNGKIKDGHYSETGHQELAKNFLDLIHDDVKRNVCNSTIGKKLL